LEGKTTQRHNYIIRHALGDQELADLFMASIVQVLFISMCQQRCFYEAIGDQVPS